MLGNDLINHALRRINHHAQAQWPMHPALAVMQRLLRQTDAQIADEYDALFGGVGKPEVFVYGSFYLAGFLNEKPLAALRGERRGVTVSGETAMASAVNWLFENLRWDLGDELSRIVQQFIDFARANL